MPKRRKNEYEVFIGLGSNVGDQLKNIQKAHVAIETSLGPILLKSSLYKSAPWGDRDQDFFTNQVLKVKTSTSPWEVLRIIKKIEGQLKKGKLRHWGPRRIDLDIIFYGKKIIFENHLIIPHPYMYLRNFVLVPLHEIAPDHEHPILKKDIRTLLMDCTDTLEVIPVKLADLP